MKARGAVLAWARGRGIWLWTGLFLAGVNLSAWIASPEAIIIAFPGAALVLTILAWRRGGRVAKLALLGLAVGLGMGREAMLERAFDRSRELLGGAPEPRRLLLRLDEPAERSIDYTVLWAQVEAVHDGTGFRPAGGRVRLAVGGDAPGLWVGDRVVALARLKAPRAFKDPGGFDYAEYLRRRGVAINAYASSAELLAKAESSRWGGLRWIDELRERYLRWLGRLGGPGGAMLQALLAGERRMLPPEVEDDFRDAGLSHLLAISGQNLALVALMIFFLVDRAVRASTWLLARVAASRMAAVATAPAVIGYAYLTGMSLPTQRALIMVLAYLVAVAANRRRETWNAMGLAMAATLTLWPRSYLETSFQLSYGCVAGMIWAYPRLALLARGELSLAELELDRFERALLGQKTKSRSERALAWVAGLVAITLVAQWVVFPLQTVYFNAATPLAALYNLVAVPLVGLLILPVGLAASLVGAVFPDLGLWLLQFPAWLGELLVDLAATTRSAPSVVLLPAMSAAGAIAWWLGGALLLEAMVAARCGTWSWRYLSPDHRRRMALDITTASIQRARPSATWGLGAVAAFLVLASGYDLARPRDPFPKGATVVAAIDVGQGQSLFYRSADGVTLLVDGGGFEKSGFDVGRGVVTPCLLALGIRRLDVVVVTHSHPDHARGLSYILRHFAVGEFWLGPDQGPWIDELLAIARRRGVRVRTLDEASGEFMLGDVEVAVLGPPPRIDVRAMGGNNSSLVLRLFSGGETTLLSGDVEAVMEARLVGRYGPEGTVRPGALRARAISAPHHGSKTSSSEAFLEAAHPQYVLISAGGPDQMGLPAQATLENYLRRGLEILRTDEAGFSAVIMKGGKVWTYQPALARP